MRSGQQIQADLVKAKRKLSVARERIFELEDELAHVPLEGYPMEPGWYEDANQQISRLRVDSEGRYIWDDGWGNYDDRYPLPALPLTRLVPEE